MSHIRGNRSIAVLAVLVAMACIVRANDDVPTNIEFNRDVRPILSGKCFACHGPDQKARKARLRFDDEASAKRKKKRGSAIVPGDPAKSEMIVRIIHDDPDEVMPPPETGNELSAREIEILRRWIAQGAEYQAHWSFAPPKRPTLPTVKKMKWARGAIDYFVLARLEAAGLSPSSEAQRTTLLRRIFFDLIGLPPKPEDVDAFLADDRPDAFERVVDRLLVSPHHGERLAIYWLDLVRYADTVGYHGDQWQSASPYRDWVIQALNDNMRFDDFTVAQLAGDLVPESTVDHKIASAYNRLLQTTHEGGAQVAEYMAKYASDRVRNVSGVWMGATVGCAECHNHKFDPYTQKDFYRLAAFFADVDEKKMFGASNKNPTTRPPEMSVVSPLDRARAERIAKRIQKIRSQIETLSVSSSSVQDGSAAKADATTRLGELDKEIAELEKERQRLLATQRKVMITQATTPRVVRVLERGDFLDQEGEVVDPGTPAFLPELGVGGRRATRLDLARWLTSKDHPQTARVFVNRLWYLYFGVGLSKVLEDTGSQGEWPTHPALLDWLAVEFVESGWNIRHVIRLIVTSSVYRQSSLVTPKLSEADPENRLFGRQSRYRLPAELVRDNLLFVSGLLVGRLAGGTARPYQPAGYYGNLNFPQRKYKHDTDWNQYRRGVYTHWQRQFLHPMLRALDAPSREECTARRTTSNTPNAALTLLNDPSAVEASRVFAERILREGGDDTQSRARWAWKLALSRDAIDKEVAALESLLRSELERFRADPDAAKQLLSVGLSKPFENLNPTELASWTSVARAILNLNETITRN
jgi:cytochrome c553